MPGVCFHNRQDSFPNIYCYVPWESQFVLDGCLTMSVDSRSLFSMDAWHLFSSTPGLFSQRLLLCPLTVAVCSRLMPGIYFHKHQDSSANVYCYVPWKCQFVLDGCRAFIFINSITILPMSTAMSLDSRSLFWMDACVYFHKHKTLPPTSTAMSLDNRSLFSMDSWRLFS